MKNYNSVSVGRTKKKIFPDKIIAERVKSARIDAGFSQKDLADYLNMGQKSVADYEGCKNRIPSQTLQSIAEFLKKPVSYFYGEEKDILNRMDKKIDIMFEIFVNSNSSLSKKLDIKNDLGLKDFLKSKGISNEDSLNDLEIYFRFVCERDNYNFEQIWHT